MCVYTTHTKAEKKGERIFFIITNELALGSNVDVRMKVNGPKFECTFVYVKEKYVLARFIISIVPYWIIENSFSYCCL